MEMIILLTLVIAVALSVVVLESYVVIWALNTLLHLGIVYTLKNVVALCIILGVLHGIFKFKVGSSSNT